MGSSELTLGTTAARWRFGTAPALRVVVAADRSELADSSRTRLASEPRVVVAGTSLDLAGVASLARRLVPRVVVVGTASHDPAVITAIRAVRAASSDADVVLVAERTDEPYVRMMLEAGARGYVSPGDTELGRAVRAVGTGGAYFSPDVADLVRRGYLRRGGLSIRAFLARLTEADRAVLDGLVRGASSGEIGARLRLSADAFDGCRRRIIDSLA
jgi:two-component system, NarL family, response regulator NreC